MGELKREQMNFHGLASSKGSLIGAKWNNFTRGCKQEYGKEKYITRSINCAARLLYLINLDE